MLHSEHSTESRGKKSEEVRSTEGMMMMRREWEEMTDESRPLEGCEGEVGKWGGG